VNDLNIVGALLSEAAHAQAEVPVLAHLRAFQFPIRGVNHLSCHQAHLGAGISICAAGVLAGGGWHRAVTMLMAPSLL